MLANWSGGVDRLPDAKGQEKVLIGAARISALGAIIPASLENVET